MTSVYVAASSNEISRAVKWMDCLRNQGIFITSTWPEVIMNRGANPLTASTEQRRSWAKQDLAELQNASIFWLLVPESMHTGGSSAEFGVAYAMNKPLISSGGTKKTIFTALGLEFEHDTSAYEFILQLHPGSLCRRELIHNGH